MSPDSQTERSQEGKAVDREISEFFLRACHDLRAPVRTILAHSELLARDALEANPADFKERLSFVLAATKRIERLADGLVNYSLALDFDPSSFQPVRVDALLRAVLGRLENELNATQTKVVYGQLPRVLANPERLTQVFEHLLRNAIQWGGKQILRIEITAQKRDADWLFAVHDNGRGIEAAYIESIFRPFEKLTCSGSEGPGLGLTICRVIVERHCGRIWAESEPEAGSTFFFTLPSDIR
jgi:two-component system, chemotaxis family, sensor kinase Cph1